MTSVPLPEGSFKQYVIAAVYHVVSGTLVAMLVWSLVTKPEQADARLQDIAEAHARVTERLNALEDSFKDIDKLRGQLSVIQSDVSYIRGRLDAALKEKP